MGNPSGRPGPKRELRSGLKSGPKPGQKRGVPRKKQRVPWMAITIALAAASLISGTAGALLAVSLSSTPLLQSKLTAQEAAIFNQNGDGSIASGSNLSLPQLNRPVNILLLGTKVLTSDLDSEAETSKELGYHAMVNSFEGLSDAILLLRFDPRQQKLSLLSIPRDTRTNVPGFGEAKINEANLEGGPALAAQTVSDLLNGVGIDRYVRVNVQAIEKLIDALGGVEVYVPHDMKYQDDSQHLYINLKQGQQHLDGDKAMQFLRFRYDDKGDIGRVQRQQMLMRAFIEQALTPTSMTRLPKVLKIVRSHIDTNLSVEELFALVNFASRTQRSDVQMLMVPGSFSSPEEYQASFWLPDYEKLEQITTQYLGVSSLARRPNRQTYAGDTSLDEGLEGVGGDSRNYETSDYRADEDGLQVGRSRRNTDDAAGSDPMEYGPAALRISIQNSTGESIALSTALDQLSEEGYRSLFAQEDWSEVLPVTRIVAQKGDLEGAKAVRRSLGMGEVVVESVGDLDSDVTVLLGRDWLSEANRRSTSRDSLAE
ncbi:MAG: LCP family protein [Synechococcales cyanobacterium CRU_2_2]|nr:LCP family protein [Synechococcales cyanobacterium CRU_2_2]